MADTERGVSRQRSSGTASSSEPVDRGSWYQTAVSGRSAEDLSLHRIRGVTQGSLAGPLHRARAKDSTLSGQSEAGGTHSRAGRGMSSLCGVCWCGGESESTKGGAQWYEHADLVVKGTESNWWFFAGSCRTTASTGAPKSVRYWLRREVA